MLRSIGKQSGKSVEFRGDLWHPKKLESLGYRDRNRRTQTDKQTDRQTDTDTGPWLAPRMHSIAR